MNIGVSTVQSRFRDIKFIPKVLLNQECTVCGAEKAYVTHQQLLQHKTMRLLEYLLGLISIALINHV